jgi:hypothetical protein
VRQSDAFAVQNGQLPLGGRTDPTADPKALTVREWLVFLIPVSAELAVRQRADGQALATPPRLRRMRPALDRWAPVRDHGVSDMAVVALDICEVPGPRPPLRGELRRRS